MERCPECGHDWWFEPMMPDVPGKVVCTKCGHQWVESWKAKTDAIAKECDEIRQIRHIDRIIDAAMERAKHREPIPRHWWTGQTLCNAPF